MNANRGVILIVDDVPTNLSVLMEFLESASYKVLVATDGESAIEQAEYVQPDIILLDVMMPGIDGFETCKRLKSSGITADIPVIFMTALSETVDKVRGFQLGAADYITKPLQQEEVVARVNAHLTVHRQKLEIEEMRQQDRDYYEKLSRIKDDILSTASHDLRNPLTAIMTSVAWLHRRIAPQELQIHERLDLVHEAAVYMGDLIGNLLDLARFESGTGMRKNTVLLKDVLEKGIRHMAIAARDRNISLRLRLENEAIAVNCDDFQIGQVLQNLISNAVKYTPEGGSVEISGGLQNSHVYIHVADTGIGIPESDIPYIFDKFYRVKTKEHSVVTGTGLGLAIVREIVRQHGGDLSVKSQPGAGSTFMFTLPG